MPSLLLPPRLDNAFRGSRIALGLFGLLVLVKGAMGLNTILHGRMVATTADGIPLDTFPPAAAQTVVALFAIWGVAHLVFALLGLLALLRYRAMVPLLFALFLLEHLTRRLVLRAIPIPRTAASHAFSINTGLLVLMVVGLALSLWPRSGNAGEL